ncbi:hypothetical protein CDD80_5765 [Ophiocordyceps camponoti-rufipedis]|uniref:Uncharacterized protein n=1 Tax=Ophiocordyceps camponoti-rufipedis TaxID=2004952 RepID=A0A2C5YV02_9HYPO|nr:hypothetical protein CDD80_5765 [Ophiocordyceps camponoti-rufipedis]
MANFPNLRRLFIEARTDNEERDVSRKAFYNAVLFMGSAPGPESPRAEMWNLYARLSATDETVIVIVLLNGNLEALLWMAMIHFSDLDCSFICRPAA